MHLDINCKRAYQHQKLIMCNIDCSPTEAFEKVHRGHGWGLDCSATDHHIQKGSNTALQTEKILIYCITMRNLLHSKLLTNLIKFGQAVFSPWVCIIISHGQLLQELPNL